MNETHSNILLIRLRELAKRHPITFFLVVAFGVTCPLVLLVLLAQKGILPGASFVASLGLDMERAFSILMIWLGLAPAVILVTALEGGRPALKILFRRMFKWQIGSAQWLIILLALPVTTVVTAILMGDTFRIPTVGQLINEMVDTLVALFLINLWEETSWAGFVQTRLERRHNFFVAAALTALPFAAIHMPLRIINGNTTLAGLAQSFALLMILVLIVRPLLGMVLRGSGDSILAAALMHTLFNRSNNIDGIAADLLVGPNRSLAALIAVLLVTVLMGVLLRQKLTRTYRQELDASTSETRADTTTALIESSSRQPAQV